MAINTDLRSGSVLRRRKQMVSVSEAVHVDSEPYEADRAVTEGPDETAMEISSALSLKVKIRPI